ncbi:RelB protein [Streptococcus dysgalactiae subsp. equisimilis GGS_124]|nr:RelB protein [Streptococcus dysgalactiae subsp. equisimilis GGS_124]
MLYNVLQINKERWKNMAMVSLRLNSAEEELFRSYATHTGKTLSELFKTALAQQIEDQLDYETGIQALKRFEENPITYSIDDLIEELENDL